MWCVWFQNFHSLSLVVLSYLIYIVYTYTPFALIVHTRKGAAQQNDVTKIWDLIVGTKVHASYANVIGQTPLHVAVLWGHLEATTMLLELGANPNAQNSYREATPLHLVLESEKVSCHVKAQIIDLLLESGAHTTIQDRSNNYPIDALSHRKNDGMHKAVYEKLRLPKRNITQLLLDDVTSSVTYCRPVT